MAGKRIARRPMRGLEIKEDRVAALKVVQSDGTEIPLVDAGSPYGDGLTQAGYTNFILQNVSEARMEKHQIVETFGESYVFFFGEAPRFLDVQMVVINSHDFNWEAEWWENYERYFRGTRLVEMGARLYMFYDDNIVEGYMLSSQAVKVSDQPFLVQMNFRLFLTGYRNITFVGDPQFPIRANVALPEGIGARDPNSRDALITTLQDAALAQARAEGLTDNEALLQNGGSFGQHSRLSNFLRSVPGSGALQPTTVELIETLNGPVTFYAESDGLPLRSKIADNRDEYLGLSGEITTTPNFETGSLGLPPLQAGTIRSQQEVENLHAAVIDRLRKAGANVDSPDALTALGLMPFLQSGGISGLGSGSSRQWGATYSYTPRSGSSFGTSTTSSTATTSNPSLSTKDQSPLGSVFGGGASAGLSTRATTQGGGDKNYGYVSAFAEGPGFGQAGYGDYGGNGFGSGQGGAGDPGYKSPELFTYEGVFSNQGAYSRFNKPRRNNTVFGSGTSDRVGLGASSGGSSGRASHRVEGKPTSFAIISAEGSLPFNDLF